MKRVLSLMMAGLLLLAAQVQAAESYKIGVLAKDGPVKALQQWKATGEYLTEKLAGKSFEIVPLGFEAVYPAVEKGEVDFFLVNSSMFITTKVKYGATAVATMVNASQGKPQPAFGGVIFTAAKNEGIKTLADLKGKAFMAVDDTSFGGWQMGLKELKDAGLDPQKDFAKLLFGGKHENVVLAVLNGAADAGTVRTDTMERMAAAGTIKMEDFTVINKKEHAGFPFVCSTPLYPEWPLAKVKKTSDALAKEVTAALKQFDPKSKAATDAKIVGWVEALDYAPVEELQKTLKIDAYGGK